MSTTMPEDPTVWREAHQAARTLHDALLALGIPETVLGPLTARQGPTGAMRVVVPPLPLADVQRILAGLGPALGPHWIGRPGLPPVPPAAVPPTGLR